MAVISGSLRHSRSPSPIDPMTAITQALSTAQGTQLLELLAAQLKVNKFIGQPDVTAHDFDISDGASEVMYVTFRMGPRRELVFKVGPQTLMRRAIDLCIDAWRNEQGGRFNPWSCSFTCLATAGLIIACL